MLARGSRRRCPAFTLRRPVTTLKPLSCHSCQTGERRTVPSRRYVARTATSGSSSKSPRSSGLSPLRIRCSAVGEAFLNATCEDEVCLVAVVPRMFAVELRRPLPHRRLPDHLAVRELIARQIEFHAAGKAVPHVRLDPLAVAEDAGGQKLAPEDVLDDERGHIALAARRVLGRPAVVLVRRVATPARSDCVFDLSARVPPRSLVDAGPASSQPRLRRESS